MDAGVQKEWDAADAKALWKARRNIRRGLILLGLAAVMLTIAIVGDGRGRSGAGYLAAIALLGPAIRYGAMGIAEYQLMPKFRVERDRELRRAKKRRKRA